MKACGCRAGDQRFDRGQFVDVARDQFGQPQEQPCTLGGEAGIAEFTELKWMTIETQPLHLPI